MKIKKLIIICIGAKLNKYTTIKKCRISNNTLEPILNLGIQPLANSLKKNKNKKEFKVKLSISYCRKSSLLQLDQTVNKNLLFDKYVWVTGTGQMTKDYANIFFNKLSKITNISKNDTIIEIASNDGTFLKPFIKNNFKKVIGVDPAKNIAKIANKKNIKTLNNYWTFSFAKKISLKYGKAKLIFARNVIPHVSNLKDVIKGIHYSLDEKGIGAIEYHDAGKILEKLQYDSIYHEHLCYFSVKSISYLLNSYNLHPFHIIESPINAGNKLILFSKIKKKYSQSLKSVIIKEKNKKLNTLNQWRQFAKKTIEHKNLLNNLIDKYKHKVIIGFGSSARSQTLLNYCNINNNKIRAIIDNNKLKQGLYTPGTNIKIISLEEGMKLKPDIIIILAWNFSKEIKDISRSFGFKGKFIIPFPLPRII